LGRFVLRLLAVSLLVCAGLASAMLAAGAPLRPGAATTRAGSTMATTTTATTTASVPTTSVSTARSALVLTGHGWGHGLGLAQWGAYGYAKHGWTYDQILAHYYSGTTLGIARVAAVRVLLAAEHKATLASTVPWNVTDGSGTVVQLDPGSLVLKGGLEVGDQQLASPLTFRSSQPLTVDKKACRGRIVVSSDGKLLQVVDTLALESYVKGVVPEEMPSSWAAEALKAQAVATRSYALANLAHGRGFDVYADTRSQVYGGVSAESLATTTAVHATKRQIVLYNGKVADTLFFSSSGGRTASAVETTGIGVPYLVSVADPYDTLSPYHDWGPVVFDLAQVGKLLKLTSPIDDVQTTTGTSKRVKTLTVTTDDELQVRLTGNQLRAELGLRSTWFTPALLELLPPTKAMTYGGAASLTGFARGAVDSLSLESRIGTGAWTPAGDIVLDAEGAFSTIVRPQVTTRYRLVSGNVRIGLARVRVAPGIDLQSTSATGLLGAIRPALTGAPVELQQQQADLSWLTLSTTLTDEGAWSFGSALDPGTYRVRCAPGHGLVPGVSTTFVLP